MSVWVKRNLVLCCLVLSAMLAAPLAAQSLPVSVDIAGNTAVARIGLPLQPALAEVSLNFDSASGLSAGNLGISAQLVDLEDAALRARLPADLLDNLGDGLPLLITIEPPLTGSLSFRRRVAVEVHTHALVYTAGSPYRLFKAPLGGAFRDITSAVTPGSVRTRGHTGGFSQFLVLADLRPSHGVIEAKLAWLRNEAALLATAPRQSIESGLAVVESAVAAGRYADAMAALDQLKADVAAAAGNSIPELWRANRLSHNSAGELLSGFETLGFSIGFLRDYGS